MASGRWEIVRQSLLRRLCPLKNDDQDMSLLQRISRKPRHGFNLIPTQVVNDHSITNSNSRDVCICYTLPVNGSPKLFLTQREDNDVSLDDFERCNLLNVDYTGIICQWPSEEVLAHICLLQPDTFRSKRVIELGSGYGLAGFVIAATTEASEVVISDGNPEVVNYVQRNIEANLGAFGGTEVRAMALRWDDEEGEGAPSGSSDGFDLIICSDCTFFKEFHQALAGTVRRLIGQTAGSRAMFLSPKRGDSLDGFLAALGANAMHFCLHHNYDPVVWELDRMFVLGHDSWPGYQHPHCYPLLITITC